MESTMIIPLFLIVLYLNIPTTQSGFLTKIKTFLSGKGKNKPKVWEFVAGSELEYPGTDTKKKAAIKEMWSIYYKCLNAVLDDLGPHLSITPEAIMAYEGNAVQLACRTCVRPGDTDRTDDVMWNYRTIPPTDTNLVELGEHRFISPEDKTLHLYALTAGDSGQYFCERDHIVTTAYFLTVVNSSEPTLSVKPLQSKEGPHPQPREPLGSSGLELDTSWGEWSDCSTCGKVGTRIRYGTCVVEQIDELKSSQSNGSTTNLVTSTEKSIKKKTKTTPLPPPRMSIPTDAVLINLTTEEIGTEVTTPATNQTRAKRAAELTTKMTTLSTTSTTMKLSPSSTLKNNFTETNKTTAETSRISSNISKPATAATVHMDKIPEIFILFINGIPCRAPIMPRSISDLPQVQERKSEVMIGLCKEPCPAAAIFTAMDEKGNVIETANNSAGIYSSLQGIPKPPPSVQRQTIYEDTLTELLILRCPGNLNTDVPIQWQIGSYNVDSEVVFVMSQGRIYINLLEQLVIKKPQPIDSNIYSCWQKNELAGTIRLIVNKRVRMDFSQHLMLLTMAVILGTIVFVFIKAFAGRRRVGILE